MKKIISHVGCTLGVFWIFLFVLNSSALALPLKKTAFIWGKTFSYELRMVHNPAVKYDGQAYIGKGLGGKTNIVVLNTAYLKKEAEDLWGTFQTRSKPAFKHSLSLQEILAPLTLLNQRLTFGHPLSAQTRKELLISLEKQEEQLAYTAWYPVYKRSAEKEAFVSTFIHTRKSTVLYHELSHLADEMECNKVKKNRADPACKENLFAFHTEVRAFLAELAYGDNPRDVLWQVMTGVVQEIKNGKNIDYSIRKLTGVLQYAKSGSDSFACLHFISRDTSKSMAFLLYRNYPLIPTGKPSA